MLTRRKEGGKMKRSGGQWLARMICKWSVGCRALAIIHAVGTRRVFNGVPRWRARWEDPSPDAMFSPCYYVCVCPDMCVVCANGEPVDSRIRLFAERFINPSADLIRRRFFTSICSSSGCCLYFWSSIRFRSYGILRSENFALETKIPLVSCLVTRSACEAIFIRVLV